MKRWGFGRARRIGLGFIVLGLLWIPVSVFLPWPSVVEWYIACGGGFLFPALLGAWLAGYNLLTDV